MQTPDHILSHESNSSFLRIVIAVIRAILSCDWEGHASSPAIGLVLIKTLYSYNASVHPGV